MIVMGGAPAKTPIDGMAVATVAMAIAEKATHTLLRSGVANVATTSSASARSKYK
jgi:hypothetical protein